MLINCKLGYKIYKALPIISFATTALLLLAWAIVDAAVWITVISDLDWFLSIPIWITIGSPLPFFAYLVASARIAPTIIRTDATVKILQMMKKQEQKSPNAK